MTLLPGDYLAEVRAGHLTQEVPLKILADQEVQLDVDMNAGMLTVTAPKNTHVRIRAPEKGLDGVHKVVTSSVGDKLQFPLRAGAYLLEATIGSEVVARPIEVAAGQRVEVTVP